MTTERIDERFTTTVRFTGDREQIAAWEAEQRVFLEHDGIADFEFTYEDGSATLKHGFTARCEKCHAPWTRDECPECGGRTLERVQGA